MQVHAAAVVAIAEFVLAGLGMAALGCSVGALGGDEDCKNTFELLAKGIDKTVSDGCYGVADIYGKLTYHVTPEYLEALGNRAKELWGNADVTQGQNAALLADFPNGVDFVNPVMNTTFLNNLFRPSISYTAYVHPTLTNYFTKISIIGKVGFRLNTGGFYTEYLRNQFKIQTNAIGSSGSYSATYKFGTDNVTTYYSSLEPTWWKDDNRYNFALYSNVLAAYTATDGKSGYVLFCPTNSNATRIISENGIKTDELTAREEMSKQKVWLHGKSIGLNPVKDVVKAVTKAVGVVNKVTGVTTIPLINTGSDEKLDEKNRTQTQEQTIGKDIATTADKVADATENKTRDTSVPKPLEMPDLSLPEIIFKEKFPFCLPWDFYTAFSNLVAPAKPPVFVYPIKLSRLGIDQSITLDFSPYGTLAAICRWFISLSFIVWLILITRKMIGN